MTEPVTLWRCSACGKWSHAVKRPKNHQRAVFDEPAEGVEIVNHEAYFGGGEYSEPSPEVWWIKCGPFDEWAAALREMSF